MRIRKRRPHQYVPEPGQTPLEALDTITGSIGEKAEKNKSRARTASLLLTGATALIPAFIGLGGNFFFAKVAPSGLAAFAAIVATWVQIERPHERWNLYRRYHRLFETERLKYVHHAPPYDDAYRDARLITLLAKEQMNLHDEWAGLLPSTSSVAGIGKSGP